MTTFNFREPGEFGDGATMTDVPGEGHTKGWDPMDEAACLAAIRLGEEDAFDLLMAADSNFRTRFKRIDTALIKLIDDVREYFPDAQYYTASGGFNLMLGSDHNQNSLDGQQELIALAGNASIGDGDF